MGMKKYKLGEIAYFVEEKISSDELTLNEYITTDCLLQNKKGRTIATNLPPKSCSLTKFKKGDVLIGNIRPYLKKIWFAESAGGCSLDVLVLRAKKMEEATFIYSLLLQDDFFDFVMKAPKGSKMPRGDKNHILTYPCFDIQNKIEVGNFFSNIDKKIALNKKINAKLEAMVKRLYDYWFVQFDYPDKNGKPYKTSGGKMVWNEVLKREIPEGWEVVQIQSILDKYPSTKRFNTSEYLYDGKYPIVDQDSSSFIAGYTNEENELLKQFPAVLFGDHSTCVKFLNFEFCRGADGTQILYSNEDRIKPYYLYLAVKSLIIPNQGYSRHFKYLKELPVILPSLELADKFQKIVKPTYEKKTKCDKQIEKLSRLRDRLLPLLMNGQVEVK